MTDRIIPGDARGRPYYVRITGPLNASPDVVLGKVYRVILWWEDGSPIVRPEPGHGAGWLLARPDGSDASRAFPAWVPAPEPAPPASDAVEAAKQAVVDAAKQWERDPSRGLARSLSMANLVDAVEALLAAERAAQSKRTTQ